MISLTLYSHPLLHSYVCTDTHNKNHAVLLELNQVQGSHDKTVKELHEMKRKFEFARSENDSLKRRLLDSKLEKQGLKSRMSELNQHAMSKLNQHAMNTGSEVANHEKPATASTGETLEEYFTKCLRNTKQRHRSSL